VPSDEYWWPTASDLQGDGEVTALVHFHDLDPLIRRLSSGGLISLSRCSVISRLTLIVCVYLLCQMLPLGIHPLSLQLPCVQTPGLCVH